MPPCPACGSPLGERGCTNPECPSLQEEGEGWEATDEDLVTKTPLEWLRELNVHFSQEGARAAEADPDRKYTREDFLNRFTG